MANLLGLEAARILGTLPLPCDMVMARGEPNQHVYANLDKPQSCNRK
jgi:hypothetical protein